MSSAELAKLARYTNYQKLCNSAFVMFALTWVYTRLAYYPTTVIYTTTLEAGQFIGRNYVHRWS